MTQKSHAKSEKEIGLWFGKRHEVANFHKNS